MKAPVAAPTGGGAARLPPRALLRELYRRDTPRARAFRYGLLAFDAGTLLFIVATSFAPVGRAVHAVNLLLGALVLADLGARVLISRRPLKVLLHWATLADLAAAASFLLAPFAGGGAAFLRALRTVRFLHAYRLLSRLRADLPWFRRHEDVAIALAHLLVFIFVMTGLVYETQHRSNPDIANYADALYFTVTALTTTGFGDITLPGTGGRLISVVVMICGVTLFLRLAQVLFRPNKVRHECPTCGLTRHDPDAVHCKHCGLTLHIETEGAV